MTGRQADHDLDGHGPVVVSTPRAGVALITLNDPASLNAMSRQMVDDLRETLEAIGRDRQVRIVVLTGAGRGFSSGHGFDDLSANHHQGSLVEDQLDDQRSYSSLIIQLHELPQVVIAAVNGAAAGGGLAMALAADTRVCSASARFNAAFVRLGIGGCDVGTSYLLPRIVGPTVASEMMLTGRLIDADEALATGLVLSVVPDGEVVDAALRTAELILANSPLGVRMTKRTLRFGLEASSLRHAVELEDRTQVLCLQTGDLDIALPALRERRTVDWSRREQSV